MGELGDGTIIAKDYDILERAIGSSPILEPILDRWRDVCLPNCWLVAGAVAQTVWNAKLGYAPDHGIRDIDIAYHDASDLTSAGEEEQDKRVRSAFAGLQGDLDVKNEARVHLWYEARFGYSIEPYRSVEDAIGTFPTTATAIGIRPGSMQLEVMAPFGLTDLCGLIVRPNKVQITRQVYDAKVSRWRMLWPALDIRPWCSAEVARSARGHQQPT